jgi:hypothetical protein
VFVKLSVCFRDWKMKYKLASNMKAAEYFSAYRPQEGDGGITVFNEIALKYKDKDVALRKLGLGTEIRRSSSKPPTTSGLSINTPIKGNELYTDFHVEFPRTVLHSIRSIGESEDSGSFANVYQSSVWTCGQNSYGELAHGDIGQRSSFARASFFDSKEVVSVVAGRSANFGHQISDSVVHRK